MALIKCKECGKEISTNATICPNCGNPNVFTEEEKEKAIKDKKENNIIIIISIILGAIIFIALFATLNDIFEETGDLIDDSIDSYIEQRERDEKLKKDLYEILKD